MKLNLRTLQLCYVSVQRLTQIPANWGWVEGKEGPILTAVSCQVRRRLRQAKCFIHFQILISSNCSLHFSSFDFLDCKSICGWGGRIIRKERKRNWREKWKAEKIRIYSVVFQKPESNHEKNTRLIKERKQSTKCLARTPQMVKVTETTETLRNCHRGVEKMEETVPPSGDPEGKKGCKRKTAEIQSKICLLRSSNV